MGALAKTLHIKLAPETMEWLEAKAKMGFRKSTAVQAILVAHMKSEQGAGVHQAPKSNQNAGV